MKSLLGLAFVAALVSAQTQPVSNSPVIVPRPAGSAIKVPAGFSVDEYAGGFVRPRFMVEGPGGEVLVSETVANGSVIALRNGAKKVLLSGLDRPYGLALWHEYLYVGEPESLKRYKYDSKALTVGAGEEVVSMAGYSKGHVTRTILFDERAGKMYLTIGSSADLVTGDPEKRAAVHRYNPDGTGDEIVATGLRNTVGLRFYPGSTQLWATVEERTEAADVRVADFFTSLKPGGFYGWPYAYVGPHADPRIPEKDRRPDLVAKAIAPDVPLEPHCAVLDFVFYTGTQFPAEYRNGAFLANHGSTQRDPRVGYSVSFVPFRNGKPAGPVRDFATGWMLAPDKKEVWGRPVGLLQLRDGSLLLSDDGGKVIWRMSYKKD
ncbi:MAG TPA: PQQ-dependent sugar dehydrogenase [Candidatus Sulfopaludibacter sp.]|jgi:glucose/arabinose dehydrogenase|nr:PQQ-dependent sugar dehydrogenase [Candidatus Sulfopaludibacter sp.]